MRIQAIRASESLYKTGDKSFAGDYKRMTQDPSVDVAIQAMLTINKWKVPDAAATIKATADANKARGVQVVANTILNPPTAGGRGGFGGRGAGPAYTAEQQGTIDRGGQIYRELCFSCHGDDGLGAPRPGDSSGATMAPRLAGSPRVNGHRDYVINAVLHGLAGPVDDKNYTDVMVPMGSNPDDWIAAVASYVRTSFGNTAGLVTSNDVKRVRTATSSRKLPWSVTDLEASLPKVLLPDPTWKLTASHNPTGAAGAMTLASWSSQAPQAPGMWFQVELPKTETITEVQFESTNGGGRGGRGGAGRGAAQPANLAATGAAAAATSAGEAPAPQTGGRAAGPGAPGGAPPNPGYPRGYKLETSMNGTAWTVAAEGQGSGSPTIITFRPVQTKFVRLTQTAAPENAPPLSIQQLRLYRVGGTAVTR
jgi:mono/diheme cytochrome c family protein